MRIHTNDGKILYVPRTRERERRKRRMGPFDICYVVPSSYIRDRYTVCTLKMVKCCVALSLIIPGSNVIEQYILFEN